MLVGALLNDLSILAQDNQLVALAEQLVVTSDEQHSAAPDRIVNGFLHGVATLLIQSSRHHFVKDQDLRIPHKSPRHINSLPLALRQIATFRSTKALKALAEAEHAISVPFLLNCAPYQLFSAVLSLDFKGVLAPL